MTPTHKPQHQCVLEIPRFGAEVGPNADTVTVTPRIIHSKLTRNSHLEADELTITLGWDDSGVDVRALRHARVLFYLWDASAEDFDASKHLRFVGICESAKRIGGESDVHVEMTFADFTTLFVEMKNYPQANGPEWSDTLQAAWERVCDNTGWYDIAAGKIVSSVAALKSRLVFRVSDPAIITRTLGAAVPERFRAISKPGVATGTASSAWKVWQDCVGMLGLISYIDKDQCIVTDNATHFSEVNAAVAIWGENILTIEEEANARAACAGILLKSFDSNAGRVIEAFYPPLGDPRIVTKRPKAKRAPTENDLANAHYLQFNYFAIQNEALLEERARTAYEQFSRQELEGTLTTEVMSLDSPNGAVSVFDLGPGQPIAVHFRAVDADFLSGLRNDGERRAYLLDRGYSPDMAAVIIQNSAGQTLLTPTFNTKTVTIELGPETFKVEIRYWNRIRLE